MKEKLDQLTLSQFVDLVCGDTSLLLDDLGEAHDSNMLVIATRNIVLEYRSIADPGGAIAYFKHVEDWIKAKIDVIIFTMCYNLAMLNQYGSVREILEEYGMSVTCWKDERVNGTVQTRLAKSQRILEDMEAENEKMISERREIRAQFDAQMASVMAHFKFQIDPATIKATLYANLVARLNREVKALTAAMNRK